MTGLLCLQGGHEFTEGCREMDAVVLARSGAGSPGRPVAVLAGAARPGGDHDGAVERARRHYEQLGADVVGIPDPRVDRRAALAALDDGVGLLILPGGSPSSLLDTVLGVSPELGRRIVDLHGGGMSISGASAGAMVLCDVCVLPERRRQRRIAVAYGLGLVEGIALPHWRPDASPWPMPDDVLLWGLPECGGVLIDGNECEAVGHGTASCRPAGFDWAPILRAVAP